MNAVKLLGSLMGNNATGGNLLGSLLGGATGANSSTSGGGAGGLGALAGMLGGGGSSGGGGAGGGLGALAGMLGGGGGGAGSGQAAAGAGGIGGLLGALTGAQAPQQQEQDEATLLIRAMCNAAKADGQVDQAEIQNIVSRLGEIDQAEAEFVKQELQSPIDIQAFAASVPADSAQKVYAMSLAGMKLDTQQEAQYLGTLAQGLNLNPAVCNQIHSQLGAPQIFK